MKIGTLIIQAFGDLLDKRSIDALRGAMDHSILSVSDKFDFDYKRFE